MREVELKFIVDRDASRGLWTRARALNLVTGERRTRTLRSVYFDTPDHALRSAGISIRLRRDKHAWIQTVKAGRTMDGGLSRAEEVEIPAPGGRLRIAAIPNEPLRKAILQCTNGASLQPVCETVIRRTSGECALEGGTRAELALDVGDIRADDASAELREVEIELIEGEASGLFELARVLLPGSGLAFSRLSKAERGYLLAEQGVIDPPAKPVRADRIDLKRKWDAERAAQVVLRSCLGQIEANIAATRQLDDPEAPHQLRIGLRGLRSAFSVFRPVLQSPKLSVLADEARWLGQQIGRLRDLDVVLNDIVRPEAAAHPDEPSLAELADVLAQHGVERRLQVRRQLAEPRVQAFLLDLSQFIETMGWREHGQADRQANSALSMAELAESALSERWKTVRKQARRIDALDGPQRHELRKQLKKLRYSTEFLSSLYPRTKVKPFLKRLRKLQNAFGDLNDVTIAQAIFDALERDHSLGTAPQRAMGWVIGAGRERAETSWADAMALWEDLRNTSPFWR